jgi:8-oxo-dGTP pyrophosphatase MutT (NUDIX family)
MPWILFILIALLLTQPTNAQQPQCPATGKDTAPSAGCLTLLDGHLLVIKAYNGKISIPGGSVDTAESAQCGAHRETWEETGLSVQPQQLLRVFNNGFHLFHCLPPATSTLGDSLKPPFWLEIRQAFWLKPEHFDQHSWRFPDQRHWLAEWIQANSP